MITTEELHSWKYSILSTKECAEDRAQKYSNSPEMSRYYIHLVSVADAQLVLIERLIRQSEDNEIKGE